MSARSVPYQPKPHQWSQGDRESDRGCGGSVGGSTFKDPCDYIGPTLIIWDNRPIVS